jgi:hypothetical protein
LDRASGSVNEGAGRALSECGIGFAEVVIALSKN